MRRKRPLFIWHIICMLIIITSLLASRTEADGAVLKMSHELGWAGKESFDPASPTRFVEAVLFLYDTLVRIDGSGRAVPHLAMSWSSNATATVWTFKLQTGVVFHDGRPMTAKDVAYTVDHILDPAVQSPVAAPLSIIQAVDTPAEDVVVFTLSQPFADFPVLLGDHRTGIIPHGRADEIGRTGVGTGPFILQTVDLEGTTVFRANLRYWRGRPKLDGIELICIVKSEDQVKALLDGTIDLGGAAMTPHQVRRLSRHPEITVQSFPTGNWIGLIMRTDTPPFDDSRVRKALRIVADRREIIDELLDGLGAVTCDHPVWEKDPYRARIGCPPDPEGARKLLAAAGYPDGITVRLYVAPFNHNILPLATLYQKQAARAGITVDLAEVPTDVYWSKTWKKEPFFGTFWYQRPADQILNEAYRSGAQWNESFWNNPEFDAILDAARRELDFDRRRALYRKAQRIIYEDGGTLIPLHYGRMRVFKKNVSGFSPVSFLRIDWDRIEKLSTE